MIEGLKVTVPGTRVKQLVRNKLAKHLDKVLELDSEWSAMSAEDEAAARTSGLRHNEWIEEHSKKVELLRFTLSCVDEAESYLLSIDELTSLDADQIVDVTQDTVDTKVAAYEATPFVLDINGTPVKTAVTP